MSRYYTALLAFIFVWIIAVLVFDGLESTQGVVLSTLAGLVAAGLVYAYTTTKK